MMIVFIHFHTSIFISQPAPWLLLFFSLFLPRISFSKTRNLPPKIYGERQKKHRGAAPRTLSLRDCAPPQVGAKCLPAVVLDNHNRAHSLNSNQCGFEQIGPRSSTGSKLLFPVTGNKSQLNHLIESPNRAALHIPVSHDQPKVCLSSRLVRQAFGAECRSRFLQRIRSCLLHSRFAQMHTSEQLL